MAAELVSSTVGHRGVVQRMQDVQDMSEKFFGQALAAVIRVCEKFCNHRPAVVFGDDDGCGDLPSGPDVTSEAASTVRPKPSTPEVPAIKG